MFQPLAFVAPPRPWVRSVFWGCFWACFWVCFWACFWVCFAPPSLGALCFLGLLLGLRLGLLLDYPKNKNPLIGMSQ